MHDTLKIIIGLVVFLILMTFPLWYNLANGKATYRPEPEVITKSIPGKDKCILPAEQMRVRHMSLLNQWRDSAVRRGVRTYAAGDGRSFEMSLTRTCLDCHSNKDTFCDRCHNYLNVKPYCWGCHLTQQDTVQSR